jgi:hypothetical protein
MARTVDHSTDRTASTEQPDVGFYLPGMPSPSVGKGSLTRLLANFVRRRGVLPADRMFAADETAEPQQRAD